MMKIKIEIDPSLTQDEVLIRCRQMDERILKLQQAISGSGSEKSCISLQDGDTRYYVPLSQILFSKRKEKGFRPIPPKSCI